MSDKTTSGAGTKRQALSLVGSGKQPTLPSRYPRLATIQDCRKEAAYTYRQVRHGLIDSAEGSRRIYMLLSVGKLIEIGDLEHRLTHLEAEESPR